MPTDRTERLLLLMVGVYFVYRQGRTSCLDIMFACAFALSRKANPRELEQNHGYLCPGLILS